MSLRSRLAAIVAAVLMLAGAGAAVAEAQTVTGSTKNDACVVIPPAKVAVCVQRF